MWTVRSLVTSKVLRSEKNSKNISLTNILTLVVLNTFVLIEMEQECFFLSMMIELRSYYWVLVDRFQSNFLAPHANSNQKKNITQIGRL